MAFAERRMRQAAALIIAGLASVPVSLYLFMWAFGLAAVLFNRAVTGGSSRTSDDLAFLLPAVVAAVAELAVREARIEPARVGIEPAGP